uniref:Uncharacterized protein n=1 Tax=Nelumbo nucifera TaxID=4432 RepID=A0A822ZR18_NELNU|nr:TPA_asm: hypothetical protein HUJ06_017619 [Nelumbo nucifera]
MVLSWLLNSLHRDLAPSVLYTTLASDVWINLKDRFSLSNGPCIYQLQRSIATLRQHILKALWDELSNFVNQSACHLRSLESVYFLPTMGAIDAVLHGSE